MTDKIAIVTGATGAIGKAIAHELANQGLHVVMVVRDEPKAQRTKDEIIGLSNNPNVRYVTADLSRHSEIKALAHQWEGPLHILVNNAAVTPRSRQETPEGIELQFATNVLGYYWMTQAFREILKASGTGRIVDVASYWAGGLDLEDLEFERRGYRVGAAYRQSKQANRMLVVAWSSRLTPDGVTINACHPGDVNSTLSNNLGFGGSQSPEQGAETPVWLAISKTGGRVSGKYFENMTKRPDRFSQDKKSIESLFEICSQY